MIHLRDMGQDIIGPFKNQQKVIFYQKKCTWTWKLQMRWNQREVLEDILSFPKSPVSSLNVKNWASYDWCKLDNFEKVHEMQNEETWIFGLMGLCFWVQTWLWHYERPLSPFIFYLWCLFLLLWFYSFKVKINQIKYQINYVRCMDLIFQS